MTDTTPVFHIAELKPVSLGGDEAKVVLRQRQTTEEIIAHIDAHPDPLLRPHLPDVAVLLCEDWEHAEVVHTGLMGTNAAVRDWHLRQQCASAQKQDVWDGNAVWLTLSEMAALLDGVVPDSARARIRQRLGERNEQHKAMVGKRASDRK